MDSIHGSYQHAVNKRGGEKHVKFLVLWRSCPSAQLPGDPMELQKIRDTLWGLQDMGIGMGTIKDSGFFLDGTKGYFITEADATQALQAAIASCPFVEYDMIAPVVPFEEGKALFREDTKAKLEAMKR